MEIVTMVMRSVGVHVRNPCHTIARVTPLPDGTVFKGENPT